jgi:catechol 2,3-dioxygenase-like lactoylglutathione lyase family enzyme
MTVLPLLLGMVIPMLAAAQPQSTPSHAALPAPPQPAAAPVLEAQGAFFALSVADARAGAKWYQEKLGLTIVMDSPKQGRHTVIALEGGGLIVELIQDDDAVPLASAAPATKGNGFLVHGVVKAGVIVSDFDGTLAKLRERGVTLAFGPFPAKGNQRANFAIKDNAGNLIQFFGR